MSKTDENIWDIYTLENIIATCAIFRSTFATSIYNTCNVPLKHLKHLKYTLATCAFSVASACCLDEWRLVDAELNAAELGGDTARQAILGYFLWSSTQVQPVHATRPLEPSSGPAALPLHRATGAQDPQGDRRHRVVPWDRRRGSR